VLPDPSKDEVFLFETPGADDPEAVLLPVMHGYLGQSSTYRYGGSRLRFEEFGFPFYVVLSPEEKNDYDKIYEKIRRKYAQFSAAEELVTPAGLPVSEEPMVSETTSDENDMEDVVTQRQEANLDMVTIRIQHYQKPGFVYSASGGIEMPTTVDSSKVENLPDLRDFLRPPIARMESVAPSAMESVHQGPSTPPDSDQSEGFVDAMDGDLSEDTTYFSQHGQFMETPSTTVDQPELSFTDDDDDDMLNTDRIERASTPLVGMQDDSDEEFPTASQIGDFGRAHAPSPVNGDVLPAYSSLYPSTTSTDEDNLHRALKFGDALVCVWSDQAYQHVFNNLRIPTYWTKFEAWQDPNPPQEASVPQKRNIDLDDCLDEFAREEQLGENDEWWCPKCKAHRQARKTLELWRVPDIFVVHLKRFSSNRSFRDKLDNLIDFPITDLDLTERVGDKFWIEQDRGGERLVYDLFAVDCHFGGLGGGHYTAYAKNFVDDKWYYFDGISIFYLINFSDSSVRSAQATDAVSSAAYLLFYRRRSEEPLGGDTAPLTAEFIAKKEAEAAEENADADAEEESNTTSPKPDGPERSESSSPSPRVMNLKPFVPPRKTDVSVLDSVYAPLKAGKQNSINSTPWSGGWSNRAAGAQPPSLAFPFGLGPLRSSEKSLQLEESENVTPGDGDEADVESTNDDDNDVEVIPLGTETSMDDVEVISIEASGEQPTSNQRAA
jgi:ubiquitin carboxyl-terminal hydrolase 4/11